MIEQRFTTELIRTLRVLCGTDLPFSPSGLLPGLLLGGPPLKATSA